MASKKSKRNPNAPKKPATGYILFCADHRSEIPASIKNSSVAEQGKYLGGLWSKADQDVKDKYNQKYRALMEKYHTEMEAYKLTPDYAKDMELKKSDKVAVKKKSASSKPKGQSAYNTFVNERLEKIKKEEGEEVDLEEKKKELSEEWKKLSAEEKRKYEKISKDKKKETDDGKLAAYIESSSN